MSYKQTSIRLPGHNPTLNSQMSFRGSTTRVFWITCECGWSTLVFSNVISATAYLESMHLIPLIRAGAPLEGDLNG